MLKYLQSIFFYKSGVAGYNVLQSCFSLAYSCLVIRDHFSVNARMQAACSAILQNKNHPVEIIEKNIINANICKQ
ncbi:MAG: Hypothetical protein BHV28_12680 [Candidatus Tokpelaia hoelldobleri]|uniref:Uncharacterized protein n=1 Tax=Candidatus Tokpelaia hoelldobleri TaxID=1902579 RepID=A0A1U9JVQ1_9HYPH|nr:MAG: Hypothetical protein BHV28_12680 [Candidatus Tokpelaia hoelldoblerii]